MSSRRCPSCGGLVVADASFCPQCFTRFDRGVRAPEAPGVRSPQAPARPAAEPEGSPAEPRPIPSRSEAKGTSGLFVRTGEELAWACPTCEMENPIEAQACVRCGTPFRSLFAADEERPKVEPGRARALSLAFPGLGHRALGRGAEGLARAVVFLWVVVMAVAIVIVRRGAGLGPFLPLVALLLVSAALIYGLTSLDAGRIAEGRRPFVSSRALLYGMAVLMLVTVGTLLAAGIRARS